MNDYIVASRNVYKMPMSLLQEKVRPGEAAKQIGVGDRFILMIDGKEAIHEVIGIDAERLVNQELKHSITLQLVGLMEERPFDINGRNVWEHSTIRKYLHSDEFASRYEGDIREYTADVYKKNSNGEETIDRFFLLSKEEYEGGYPKFRNEKDRAKVNDDGETDWHMTRSANRETSNVTWYVGASGYVGYGTGGDASDSHRFAPAFVIA